MDKKKIIVAIVMILLAIAGILFGISYTDKDVNEISEKIETMANMVEDNKSSTEIPNLQEEDEQTLEVQETEAEAFEEQGEIAYNGSDKVPDVSVGEYAGLTYYSQVDSRWKSHIYTSIGDNSQTIGTSGCGPTSAAMVVSSIKGNITPDVLADLYVQYGYRSANSGTYWSAFRWTADVFNIEYQETSSLDVAINKLKDNNYIIVSCGNGLFTYGGHLIVIVGIDENTLKIYDPYLYSGKFDTSTRRGKVTVSGNTIYCSVENFRNYANSKGYFCFKSDRVETKENNTIVVNQDSITSNISNTNYQVKVTANSGLRIRQGASTSYARIGAYSKNTVVTILAESNGWGKTDKGWICLAYTTKVTTTQSTTSTTSNKTYTLISNTKLYTTSGMSIGYNYKKGTKVTLISSISNSIAKVRIDKTGLTRYVNIKYLK